MAVGFRENSPSHTHSNRWQGTESQPIKKFLVFYGLQRFVAGRHPESNEFSLCKLNKDPQFIRDQNGIGQSAFFHSWRRRWATISVVPFERRSASYADWWQSSLQWLINQKENLNRPVTVTLSSSQQATSRNLPLRSTSTPKFIGRSLLLMKNLSSETPRHLKGDWMMLTSATRRRLYCRGLSWKRNSKVVLRWFRIQNHITPRPNLILLFPATQSLCLRKLRTGSRVLSESSRRLSSTLNWGRSRHHLVSVKLRALYYV